MTGTVLLRYFAAASEAAGAEEETIEPPVDATIGWLRGYLAERYGAAMSLAIANGSFLVDGVASTDAGHGLGRQVDVLPPFAGG